MRRPAAVLTAASLALGLALGTSLLGGLAASAADPITTIDSPYNDLTITDTSPTISGTAAVGAEVTVFDTEAESSLCSTTADVTGAWSCVPDSPLAVRDYTIEAAAQVGTGQPSNSNVVTFTVALPDPEITLDATGPIYETDIALSFSGTSNRTISGVQITFADETTGTCDIVADSDWACDYSNSGGLPVGDATLDFSFVGGGSVQETFTVLPIDENGVPNVTDYAFTFGGVTVSGDPTAPGSVVATQIYFPGDEDDLTPGCPDSTSGELANDFAGLTPGHFSCEFTNLHPGLWGVYSYQDIGDGVTRADPVDKYFFIPQAPVVTSVGGNAANVLTISGNVGPLVEGYDNDNDDDDVDSGADYRAFSGDLIHVYSGTTVLCTAVVQDDESWSCSTPNALPAGTYVIQAAAEDATSGCECYYQAGGLSALSTPAVGVTLPTLSTGGGNTGLANTGTTTTTTTPIAPVWSFTLTGLDLSNVHPGDTFTITGAGLPAGSVITIELHSTPVVIGSTTVATDGTFTLKGTIPEGTPAGEHHIVASLTGAGLTPTTADKAITVTHSESTASSGSGSTETSAGAETAHDTAATGAEHEATAPNILTNSLNPIVDVLNDPGRIPAAFAAGLVLLIFAIMPAHLLNATIGEQYERLARRVPALRTQPRWYSRFRAFFARAPFLGGLALTTVTAFLFVFADPTFGFNEHSLRLFLALAGALLVVTYLANLVTALIVRRSWSLDVVVAIRPLGLVLTIVGVILSRVLDFSPGLLIGLVLGLSIASKEAAKYAWRAVLVRTSVIVVFAVIAWITYSTISADVHHNPTFQGELVLELFVAIVTEGIVMLLVELLPFHLLEGERIFRKSKVLWGTVYTVLLAVFLLAVIPWEGNWRELGESFWPWFTVVAAFGIVCIAIYLFFRFVAPPLHDESGHDGQHDDEELVAVGDDS